MKFRIAAAFLAMTIAIGGLVYLGMQKNMVYYFTVDEFLKKPFKERVRVSGTVKPGSIHYPSPQEITFTITHQGSKMPVHYRGIVPDAFKERGQAVVEGTYTQKVFQADTLMAKCPSKFQGK